jgi:thiol-disulfide isomerase/thioredoxin
MTNLRWLLVAMVFILAIAVLGCIKGTQPNTSGQTKPPTGGAAPGTTGEPGPGSPVTPGEKTGTETETQQPGGGLVAPPEKPGEKGAAGAVWTGNAQDFEVTGFDGVKFKISKYAGQPVVLNFWADWCGPCKAEFPDFQEVYKAKKGQFVLISVATPDSNDPVAFVKQNGYDWIFANDSDGAKRYGASSIPLTLFISRMGDIVEKQLGSMDKATFESKLAKIL